ncbi:unnamed protein product, partial [Prorocentrum cordatum]
MERRPSVRAFNAAAAMGSFSLVYSFPAGRRWCGDATCRGLLFYAFSGIRAARVSVDGVWGDLLARRAFLLLSPDCWLPRRAPEPRCSSRVLALAIGKDIWLASESKAVTTRASQACAVLRVGQNSRRRCGNATVQRLLAWLRGRGRRSTGQKEFVRRVFPISQKIFKERPVPKRSVLMAIAAAADLAASPPRCASIAAASAKATVMRQLVAHGHGAILVHAAAALDAHQGPQLFTEFESISCLALNIKKTVFIPLWKYASESNVRGLIRESAPAWRDIAVCSAGKYLGFWIGPGAGLKSWEKPDLYSLRETFGFKYSFTNIHCVALAAKLRVIDQVAPDCRERCQELEQLDDRFLTGPFGTFRSLHVAEYFARFARAEHVAECSGVARRKVRALADKAAQGAGVHFQAIVADLVKKALYPAPAHRLPHKLCRWGFGVPGDVLAGRVSRAFHIVHSWVPAEGCGIILTYDLQRLALAIYGVYRTTNHVRFHGGLYLKDTILTDDFELDQDSESRRRLKDTTRKLREGELLEVYEWPRKEEKSGLLRMKAKVKGDGAVGWVTTEGNQGTAYCE